MVTLKHPRGREIQLDEAQVSFYESHGWARLEEKKGARSGTTTQQRTTVSKSKSAAK
jgi:hypothetical protein